MLVAGLSSLSVSYPIDHKLNNGSNLYGASRFAYDRLSVFQNGYPVTVLVRLGVVELNLCVNRPYHRRFFLIKFGDGMPDLPVVVIWSHGG